ncbi:MAG: aminotransferase class I/II-fold pyridoxal phosphate-dependent enzyme [Rhodococcus sp.]|nr:aminotransferase class I/II-fold pyridoxal phosphate-dependent enzyme [Rhodococcus sp. (in: high G+C Gram-positive bacteria)]
MTTDSREIARRLLARSVGSPAQQHNASDAARDSGSVRNTLAPAAAGARVVSADFDPTFTKHPGVIEAEATFGNLDTVFSAVDLPNPFYLPHQDTNGPTVRYFDEDIPNFGSFSYLGMAVEPRVREAAKSAIDTYGTSVSAARIVSGEIPLYNDIETHLAGLYGVDDAIVTASGYLTNAATVGFLLSNSDLAVCDSLVHSSVLSGTQWAGCRRLNFRHNDPASLDAILSMSRSSFGRAMVIIEGHYSMDGDIPRLPEIIEVARKHRCSIMIDEAHSFGVLGKTGKGVRELFDLPGDAVDVWMGTLSKAMGSVGGFVAGSHELVQAFKYTAPGLSLYATGPAPSAIAAALESLRILDEEPERVTSLQENGATLSRLAQEAGFDTGISQGTPIVPIILGSKAITCSAKMLQAGINVNAIVYPSVPEGEERLRFFLNTAHTTEQLEHTIDTLRDVAATI